MRLAWFTPWPPQRTGVAGRSAEVVPLLAGQGHAIDVFVDERAIASGRRSGSGPGEPGEVRVQSAHDFVWRAARGQYDLKIYQLGNSAAHEFMWPYVLQWPGLAVLHDARLHHARGRTLLAAGRAAAYRAEFAWNHPDVPIDAAELAVAGFDGAYYYLWPMTGAVIARSRHVAVHSRGGARELQAAHPGRLIDYVALGEGAATPVALDDRDRARRSLGIEPDSVAFGVFGGLTTEKRIGQILRAFRSVLAFEPAVRLVLAGASGPSEDWPTVAASLGIAHAVSIPGRLDDGAFDQLIGAMDVTLHLRWPTAVETSGPWLRALAAGRPTIITELAHQSDVPALDPRTWRPWEPEGARPVTIAIDVLDEDHSLRLAMRRVSTDRLLRERLGMAARTYWEQEHSVSRMVSDYLAVMNRAIEGPEPATPLPPLIVPRPTDHARTLLAPFGERVCALF